MNGFDPSALFDTLRAGIQDASPGIAMTAAEAMARPEAVQRGLRFLMAAYTVVWVVLALYLLTLSFRQRRLAQQLRRLRERVGI